MIDTSDIHQRAPGAASDEKTIFVNYAHADKAIARQLIAALTKLLPGDFRVVSDFRCRLTWR